jgi:hypothetical protein
MRLPIAAGTIDLGGQHGTALVADPLAACAKFTA